MNLEIIVKEIFHTWRIINFQNNPISLFDFTL